MEMSRSLGDVGLCVGLTGLERHKDKDTPPDGDEVPSLGCSFTSGGVILTKRGEGPLGC